MAQRLGIAAVLLGDPAVILLDEPVNGLDPDGVQWIRQLLRNLAAEGRTVFVSSHLMSGLRSPRRVPQCLAEAATPGDRAMDRSLSSAASSAGSVKCR